MRVAVFWGMLLVPAVAAALGLSKGEEEVNRASERIVRGDYAAAEPLLRRAIVDVPKNPYAHYNLGAVLRNQGRTDEAIVEYRQAKELFETVGPRANGAGDIANCLYGIALTEESHGDPQAAAGAWSNYIRFAQRFESEQPAVAIARGHVESNQRLARARGPFLGPQEATRPSTKR